MPGKFENSGGIFGVNGISGQLKNWQPSVTVCSLCDPKEEI